MLKMLDPTTLPTASPGSLRWRPERRPRVRAARVEDVSAGAAGEQCGELAGGQLVRLEHTRRRGTERSHRPTLGKDRLPQRHTQHEVDVELEVAGVPRRSGVGEPPLPARVLGRHPLDRQPIAVARFLGFGLPSDVPSWGTMLSREGRQYMEVAPRVAMWPGVALTMSSTASTWSATRCATCSTRACAAVAARWEVVWAPRRRARAEGAAEEGALGIDRRVA